VRALIETFDFVKPSGLKSSPQFFLLPIELMVTEHHIGRTNKSPSLPALQVHEVACFCRLARKLLSSRACPQSLHLVWMRI